MNNGFYIVGIFSGTNTRPWKDRQGQERYTHSLVVSRPYEDQFGNPQTEVNQVEFSTEEQQRINAESGKWAGKKVMIPVVVRARPGGRNGAWSSYYMPKDSKITVLPDESKQQV